MVIPNWNSLQHLGRCLGSLENAGSSPEIELLVVDNGSADGSVEYLEREGVPHVALPENTGFAAAVNLGASPDRGGRRSSSSTPTRSLEPGGVAMLLDALEADSGLGGVQPRILQLDPEEPGPGRRSCVDNRGAA